MRNILYCSVLVLLLVSSCEKAVFSPALDVTDNIPTTTTRDAADCSLHESAFQTVPFKLCGEYLMYQGELRLLNNGNTHKIQAVAQCSVYGDPNDPIEITEIEVFIFGKMHIACSVPIHVPVPSSYNTNLEVGQVPNKGTCHDCWRQVVRIDYAKSISLLEDDFVAARFRFNYENCGQVVEEIFFLTLYLD